MARTGRFNLLCLISTRDRHLNKYVYDLIELPGYYSVMNLPISMAVCCIV